LIQTLLTEEPSHKISVKKLQKRVTDSFTQQLASKLSLSFKEQIKQSDKVLLSAKVVKLK